MRLRRSLFALAAVLAGCMATPGGDMQEQLDELGSTLSSSQRRERASRIRDLARARGITQNAWLVAGLADAETGMSQCHRELTWACRGPASVDCGGGPVVAGSGDGPCSRRQGGLGMFQFDAGNYDQTLRREGQRILTVDGNIQAGLDFVIDMVKRSPYIASVSTDAQAVAWIEGVTTTNGRFGDWIKTVTHLYNGCSPSASCFSSRFARYRSFTLNVRSEMGASFWSMGGSGEFIGSPCDGSATSCQTGLPGSRCLVPSGETSGMCVSSCAGTCPDRAGFASTFCVSLDSGASGSCVPMAESGVCAAGFEARLMPRYIGSSGAAARNATVCVPPAMPVEPMMLCNDTCASASNGACEDGGMDSTFSDCRFGTDCADCGPRDPRDEPMSCLDVRTSCASGTCCGDLSCRDGVTFSQQCCVEAGQMCTSSSQCCGSMACSSGMCACRANGRSCVANGDCCSTNCVSRVCR
ncbi:MAG: hypothetical protein AB7S26_35565 [Sandaracinaceae bacterium]